MFDIHSHILPAVDDGAKDIKESLELLKMMKADGITHVMATPHFYPQDTDLDEFLSTVTAAFENLKKLTENTDLPKIYLGCELLYFDSLGQSTSLEKLCLNESDFLLLELTEHCINDKLFDNILSLRDEIGITPIIAHIERYCKGKNYKKLLKFVNEEKIPVQINAASFFVPLYKRPLKKLLNSDVTVLLGTDTHSCDLRPPCMTEALNFIEQKYGTQCKNRIVRHTKHLGQKITDKEII